MIVIILSRQISKEKIFEFIKIEIIKLNFSSFSKL